MGIPRSIGSALALAFALFSPVALRSTATAQAAPVYPAAPPAPGERVVPPAPTAPKAPPAVATRDERAARLAARRTAQAEWVAEGAHRLSVSLGFAPGLVARELPGGKPRARDAAAFRQRTVELGLAYTHDVSAWLGVRAGVAFGLGVTHLDLYADGGDSVDRHAKARVDPSYGLSIDAAPVFQVARVGFYAAPGLTLRMFFLPEAARTLTAASDDLTALDGTSSVTRRVSFKSPAVALGFRPAFGFRFGPERRVDVGFGGDLGVGFRNADVYLGMFVRAGYAFTSLVRR